MNFSPKLKRVMAEIKSILDDNDLAGVVVLHTEQHGQFFSEFMLKLNPSKSCAIVESGEIKIKAKREDKRLIYTANMLNMLAETTAKASLSLIHLSEIVDDITGASHSEGVFTPDNNFDN